MIESSGDQRGGLRKVISGAEKRAWKHLVRRLKVEDSFQFKTGHLRFSWDSKKRFRHVPSSQEGPLGDRILRRIDRAYTPVLTGNTKL